MKEIIGSLFGITRHALGLYRSKEARKYLDRVVYLEKLYYEEENKNKTDRNHALMDNIINELCIISNASSKFGQPTFED